MCKYCEQGKMIDFGEVTWNIQNTEESYEMKYENNEGRMSAWHHHFILPYLRKKTNRWRRKAYARK